MNASMRFLVWGTLPLGSLIGGFLGQHVGIRNAVWFGAGGAVLGFLPVLLSPLAAVRTVPAVQDVLDAPDECVAS